MGAQGAVPSDPGVAALRGAVAGEQAAARESTTVSRGMVCVSGAMAVAALGRSGNHRSRGVASKAVGTRAFEEPVVAEDTAKADLGYNTDMRNFELNNGRFSMFAAIGIIAAEIVSGKTAVAQLGF